MLNVEKQPHIHLTKADARPVVIVVGDSARVAQFGKMCTSSKQVAFNREYCTHLVEYQGKTFSKGICFIHMCISASQIHS